MSSTILAKAIDDIIMKEGGYVDHPSDPGGATNWGITEAVARRNGYEGEMKDLSVEWAKQIYSDQYWHAPKFSRIAAFSWPLALKLFDIGVNMGPSVGVHWLQLCLNSFNRQEKDYKDVAVDGGLGQFTFDALGAFLQKRGEHGEKTLIRAINCLQGAHYIALGQKNPKLEDFTFGWIANRVS